MQEEKTTIGEWIFVIGTLFCSIVIALSFIKLLDFRNDIINQQNNWQAQRVKCNQAVLLDGNLSERLSYTFINSEDKSIKREELEMTNREVNRLRKLLGCYFDR